MHKQAKFLPQNSPPIERIRLFKKGLEATLEKPSLNEWEYTLGFLASVFAGEKNIPVELIDIDTKLTRFGVVQRLTRKWSI